MAGNEEIHATDLEKKQERRHLAAELTAEFDIPFVIWEDFEQALAASAASGPKARKV